MVIVFVFSLGIIYLTVFKPATYSNLII